MQRPFSQTTRTRVSQTRLVQAGLPHSQRRANWLEPFESLADASVFEPLFAPDERPARPLVLPTSHVCRRGLPSPKLAPQAIALPSGDQLSPSINLASGCPTVGSRRALEPLSARIKGESRCPSQSSLLMALRSMTIDKHELRTSAGFGAAYRTHARSLLIFLTRRTYDPETALDLTAETFAQAFEARRRFRGSTEEDAAAWLFGIARHILSRYLRRGKAENRALMRLGVEVPSLEPDDLVRIVELAGLDELRDAVAWELGALRAENREALRLRVVEELSYDDVAERLAITEPAARARVSRGLRTIGRALDPPTTVKEKLA